jgi:maltooligosyltrehalose synthase
VWLDSAVVAPEAASASAYRNILSGRTVRTARYRGKLLLPLSEVLAELPVALLETAASDAA